VRASSPNVDFHEYRGNALTRRFAPASPKGRGNLAGWLLAIAWLLVACAAPTASTPATEIASSNPEWEATVAAAKREGKIVIIGPQGDEVREVLTDSFRRKYPEIEVELSSMAGNQAGPKVLTEQAAGLHVSDLLIQGPTTIHTTLRPAGAVIPVRPFLTGPDIGPKSAWRGGDVVFADEDGQYSLMFSMYSREAFMYNTDQVSPAEFTSWRDLLNPKWRGRIVLRDPRGAGGGQAFALLWFRSENLGPEFIRQLLAHETVISNDDSQTVDWIARGQYSISIGAGNARFREFMDLGLPMKALDASQLREASPITPGVANLGVAANPPHPNATKVYLNHLLSRDTQTEWSKVTGFPSLREDVPTDHIQPFYLPKRGVTYYNNYSDKDMSATEELTAFLRIVLPR
jgi:iron(III) transport system substrate-binding protein